MKQNGEFKFSIDIRFNGENFALGFDGTEEYNNKTLTKEIIDEGLEALLCSFYFKLQDLKLISKEHYRRLNRIKMG